MYYIITIMLIPYFVLIMYWYTGIFICISYISFVFNNLLSK